LNGKSIDLTAGEVDELGPFKMDGTEVLSAQIETASGAKKSDDIVLEQGLGEADLYIDSDGDYTAIETSSTIDVTDETEAVEEVVRDHYQQISEDDFSAAYDLFSSSRKSKVTMDGWTKGLQQNIQDVVTLLEVGDVDAQTATAYLEMTSYDQQDDGSTLIQYWGGNWSLVKEGSVWKLEKASLEKLGSETQE